jgi:hypothetical protein
MRGRKLRADADEQSVRKGNQQKRIVELLEEARTRFDCAVGEEFLYFRQRENRDGIYAVSLISDVENYTVEVAPLAIFRVERQHGVSLLDPAIEMQPSPAPTR